MKSRTICDNCGSPGTIWAECGTCTDAGEHELRDLKAEVRRLSEENIQLKTHRDGFKAGVMAK